MEVKSVIINDIINQLFDYSNHYIEVRNDINLNIPAFSVIETDMYGRNIPYILLNLKLIPEDKNVIAHILSHEWGHHVLRHLKPINELIKKNFINHPDERQQKENEADTYAAKFIKDKSFKKDSIIKFLNQHPFDLENRLSILNS